MAEEGASPRVSGKTLPRPAGGGGQSFARALTLLLLCAILSAGAFAAEPPAISYLVTPEEEAAPLPLPTPLPAQGPPPFEAWPSRTPEGFLLPGGKGDPAEFIHEDEKAGQWIYLSATLQVDIRRYSARVNRRDTVWYLADIRFRAPEAFRVYSANPGRPGKGSAKPEAIARQHRVIYAQNGDLFTWRVSEKQRPGIIIRDGKILHEHTYTRAHAVIPPLDELALFDDGHVEMRSPGELSARDYLALGAADVLAFGPILLHDGVPDGRLEKSFRSLEPRSALGVVAPGHFVGIMVEGRNKRSAGAPLRFVADRLLEAGCRQAFTLDGGQTAAMIFLGKNVMDPGIYNGYQKTRRQPDIVGIGLRR